MVQVRYRYGTGTVQVRYRYGTGTVQVRYRYGTGTVQVRYRYGTGTMLTPLHRLSFDVAASGMSSPVHRWKLDPASIVQAALPYFSLKDPSLTETHIPA
jgi:hypothetical protein